MSVPDANAFSPAPRSTMACRPGSSFAAAQIFASSSYIAKVRALRASGRLKVIQATSPRLSWTRSGMGDLARLGDRSGVHHGVDLGVAVAGFAQDEARVLAQQRGGALDLGRRGRHVDRASQGLVAAIHRVLDLEHHAAR